MSKLQTTPEEETPQSQPHTSPPTTPSESKASEISSTPQLSQSEAMARLIALQTETRQLLQTLATAEKRNPELEEKLAELEDDDILVRCSFEVFTRDGKKFSIKGDHPMPALLAHHSIGQAPRRFENVIFSSCVQPLNRKFFNLLNGLVKNSNPVFAGNPITNEITGRISQRDSFDGNAGAEMDDADLDTAD